MKKYIHFILISLMFTSLQAQNNEKTLNRRYQGEIRDSLSQVVLERQKAMQRYAEKTLASLPNDQKLYDESYIRVETDLIDTFYVDGSMHLDLLYRLSYNCKHIEGYTDDYPLGTYDVDSSNSARAICSLTKYFISNLLNDIFRPGKEAEITISSSADGTEFTTTVPYDGRFGDFRYCPVTFNGERLRISVDRQSGINNNCQLAYIRAQGVRAKLEETIPALRQTINNFRYVTQSYKDSVNTHYYRRSSIEIRVRDVFAETVERMQRQRMEDAFVDLNIPVTEQKNPDTYVLIIANEQYEKELIPNVPYALNDGEILSRYCVRTLGIPQRQVKLLSNATKETIFQEGVHWLTDLAKAVAGHNGDSQVPRANIIIYFAGHGFTDLSDQHYLIPNGIDINDIASLQGKKNSGCKLFGRKKENTTPTDNFDIVLSKKETRRLAEQCISIDELCNMFNSKAVPVKDFTLVVDASFDGNGRDGKPILRADRPQSNDKGKKKRKSNLRADAVILLSADFDRTAYAFDQYQHGFLTYFLLKEMKSLKDNIFTNTYQDLYENIGPKLSKESALQNKWQEISGIAGGKYKDGSWQKMKVKN